MFASPSRLDLCFVLKPKMGGNMRTIMSHRHFPPLPIVIDYYCSQRYAVKTKDMGRMLAALKRSDRVRGINLKGSTATLNKFFEAAIFPFPKLESLSLCDQDRQELKIPATFLMGSDLRLQTLKLHHISLPSIARLLSPAPALTNLYLVFHTPPVISHLISHLRSMPCLRHLKLERRGLIGHAEQPTKPHENFPLSKLTSFHYCGRSSFLNSLVGMFAAPSLREVDIHLDDGPSPLMYLPRFIDDIGERYRAVQVTFECRYLLFSFFTHSEYVGRHPPHFTLRTFNFDESIMRMTIAFSAKLSTTEELLVVFSLPEPEGDILPWHDFLLYFPNVKTLRMYGTNNSRITRVLQQDLGGPNLDFLPILEEIELCRHPSFSPEILASDLASFRPFISAREQVGLQVKVVGSDRSLRDGLCR